MGECLYAYRIHSQSVTKREPLRRNQLVQKVFTRMYDRRGESCKYLHLKSRRYRPGWHGIRDAENDIVSHFTASVADQILAGCRVGALLTGLACWRIHPAVPYYAKPFLFAWTPRRLMSVYQERRKRLDHLQGSLFGADKIRNES
jgi:hypothetical protein